MSWVSHMESSGASVEGEGARRRTKPHGLDESSPRRDQYDNNWIDTIAPLL